MVWREREEGGVVRIIADNGRDCIGKEKTKTPRKQLVYKFKIKNFYYVHIFIPILQQAESRFNTKKNEMKKKTMRISSKCLLANEKVKYFVNCLF